MKSVCERGEPVAVGAVDNPPRGERAHTTEPRVRKLDDGIIESQGRESGEMKALVAELERK